MLMHSEGACSGRARCSLSVWLGIQVQERGWPLDGSAADASNADAQETRSSWTVDDRNCATPTSPILATSFVFVRNTLRDLMSLCMTCTAGRAHEVFSWGYRTTNGLTALEQMAQ